jgi:3-hydroxyisobutyrate dehydrogenase-like beta-hydroxyacid dehydrogenase
MFGAGQSDRRLGDMMTDTIAIIAMGDMGAGVGRRLHERGARVLTSLRGRRAASAMRAERAGMIPIDSDDELIAQANFFLSIVPPGDALGLAERLKPALVRAAKKPIYVDLNAIAPETTVRIGEVVTATGAAYVDGGIVGGPPTASYTPRIYLSGERAPDVARLINYGLVMSVVDGPVGAASALKMSYAGLTKGLTAIGTAMILGAIRAGCADALREELADSQPHMLAWLARQVPAMYPKAYRWVAEMEEIAEFLEADPTAPAIYEGVARFYERIADLRAKGGTEDGELAELKRFCDAIAAPARKTA